MNLFSSNRVYVYRAADKGVVSSGVTDDGHLIRQLKHGDLKALGTLFEAHKTMVYRTALAITRDARAADDILQECFVRLYSYAASVDDKRPLKPWLYRVTVNLSYDWSSHKPTQPLDEILEWLSGLPGSFPSPDREVEQNELMHTVHEIIEELPAVHRAVIVLYYMESLSLDEIAQVLDLPKGTIKSRMHYARERLRKALTKRQQPVPEMTYEFT